MIQNPLLILLLSFSSYCYGSSTCNAIDDQALINLSAANKSAKNSIYLLGVDISNAGDNGKKLQQLITPNKKDAWSLTQYVREKASSLKLANIDISNNIQFWNPNTDPYNFAAISLRHINTSHSTWPETGETFFYVAVNLLWMNVGHDSKTRFALSKNPELRSAFSEFTIVEYTLSGPPNPKQASELIKQTFDEAITNLLRKASINERRMISRTEAESFYSLVPQPAILPDAKKALNDLYKNTRHTNFSELLPNILGPFIEEELLIQLEKERRFDKVVLLPNTETLSIIEKEWPKFASRVANSSRYSATVNNTFNHAKLIKIKNICDRNNTSESVNRQVNGIEFKTALVSIDINSSPKKNTINQTSLTTRLAADIQAPFTDQLSLQLLDAQEDTIIDACFFTKLIPSAIPINQYYDPILISIELSKAVKKISRKIINRLAKTMQNTPNLNHPSLQRYCQ